MCCRLYIHSFSIGSFALCSSRVQCSENAVPLPSLSLMYGMPLYKKTAENNQAALAYVRDGECKFMCLCMYFANANLQLVR